MQFLTTSGKLFFMRSTALLALAGLLTISACDDESVNPVQSPETETTTVHLAGQAFEYVLPAEDWRSSTLQFVETLEPYAAPDPSESRAFVGEFTEVIMAVHYPSAEGYVHSQLYTMQLNNRSRELTLNGQRITKLEQIFTETSETATGEVGLCVHTDKPVAMEVEGAVKGCEVVGDGFVEALRRDATSDEEPEPKEKEKKWVTDKDSCVVVICEPFGDRPDITPEAECTYLEGLGLKDKVTKTADPENDYDCHGWTFTCGKKWINNDQVQDILDDNDYEETDDPKPGDIVVYKKDGEITHSGHVQDDGDGGTKIESKWGRRGRYCHAPEDVPPSYGTPCYYKNDRTAPDGSDNPQKDDDTLKQI